MKLVCHTPRPPLSQWVELIWHHECAHLPFSLEKLMPTGRVDLIINLNDEALRIHDPKDVRQIEHYRGPLLSGVQGSFSVIDASQQTQIMGVAFKPGGAYVLPGLAVAEISDTHLSAGDVWGHQAQLWGEQLAGLPDAWSRVNALERALIKVIARGRLREMHASVQMALQEIQHRPATASVRQLAEQVRLSQRRFIELFTRQVGITPKLYSRIQRFQRTLKQVHARSQVDWCELAFDAGYSDQSHLIRDFQKFSGLSPTQYRTLRTEHPNHVVLTDSTQG
ncbi:helix-turn-helix domain-containing protein [Verrucomicrobium spinosum]|uniref:helix-turn-helix domain-containing protein n=1 Tax=Verrucomicrobium spinosum TaxID=2736 RepID=UPI0001744E1D|nr:helix-turn-helix domain-containing protein [Verrucomicrobium spinosum]